MLPAMVAEVPLATFDAGRMVWSVVPPSIVNLGNRFFEPGVRLQRERGQHVISSGPYAILRHPGYVGALMMFAGIALALASWWALVPRLGQVRF